MAPSDSTCNFKTASINNMSHKRCYTVAFIDNQGYESKKRTNKSTSILLPHGIQIKTDDQPRPNKRRKLERMSTLMTTDHSSPHTAISKNTFVPSITSNNCLFGSDCPSKACQQALQHTVFTKNCFISYKASKNCIFGSDCPNPSHKHI